MLNLNSLPRADSGTDRYEITGKTWNALADIVERSRLSATPPLNIADIPGGQHLSLSVAPTLLVHNGSARDIAKYGILSLPQDAPITPGVPTGTDPWPGSHVVYAGEPYTLYDSWPGRIAIAQQPIAAGKIGECVVNGLSLCKLKFATSGGLSGVPRFADMIVGDIDRLEVGICGAAEVIYCPNLGEYVPSIVRVGSPTPDILPVIVRAESGGANPTYQIMDAAGLLFANITPGFPNTGFSPVSRVISAATGLTVTYGSLFAGSVGTLMIDRVSAGSPGLPILLWCNESIQISFSGGFTGLIPSSFTNINVVGGIVTGYT